MKQKQFTSLRPSTQEEYEIIKKQIIYLVY